MILAEGTPQIAPIAAHRQDQTARAEHPQRFFLNGIQIQGRHPSVIVTLNPPSFIFPRPTDSPLPGLQAAVVHTHLTNCIHPFLLSKDLYAPQYTARA